MLYLLVAVVISANAAVSAPKAQKKSETRWKVPAEVSADEYLIYRHLLGQSEMPVYLSQVTSLDFVMSSRPKKPKEVSEELWKEFIRANSRQFFSRTIVIKNLKSKRRIYPEGITERIGDGPGKQKPRVERVSFSRAGFSKDKKEALVSFSAIQGPLSGQGWLVHLVKVKIPKTKMEYWAVKDKIMIWIS
jgi:hypothetical protein